MITFQCGHCGQNFNVSDKHAGKKGKCPKCKNVIIVPALTSALQKSTQEQSPIQNNTNRSSPEQQNTSQDSNIPEEVSYNCSPVGLKTFFWYQQFDNMMRRFSAGSILAAICLILAMLFILLRARNSQEKLFGCQLILFLGILVGGGNPFSKKKLPNAITTFIWGTYFVVTGVAFTIIGMAFTQLAKPLGQTELPGIFLWAVLLVISGFSLIGIAIWYMHKRSVEILLAQGICFGFPAIAFIGSFLVSIVRIIVNPSIFSNSIGNGLIQIAFIGISLAGFSANCFLYYKKFVGKIVEQVSPKTLELVNKIMQGIKASQYENSQDIIEIVGGGPVWKGKLWADSLLFIVGDGEEKHFFNKTDFELVEYRTSKKKSALGLRQVQFKANGEQYTGEVSDESYSRYQNWKSK